MFDEARTELADELADNNHALTFEQAKQAVSAGAMMAEQAINQHAEVEEDDGAKWVVGMEDQSVTYEIPTDGDEASEEPAEDSQAKEDPEPSSEPAAEQQTTVDLQTDSEAEAYDINGIRVDVDPSDQLVGRPTGDGRHGLRKLTNGHDAVPSTEIPYYPVPLGSGERDTEEMFYRSLGMDLPVILEGEAGTGKNQLVDSCGAWANLPVYRQEFGADTSVYDVIGEKDLHPDGGTYYILGKAAKAAIFGGIYCADEINMATGSVTSYLHPLFEEKGGRELELRGTGVTLRDLPEGVEWDPEKHLGKYIHPDFKAVGTCNPLHYADTNDMNDALRSRCVVISHPYLAETESDVRNPSHGDYNPECHLLADETGADPDDVEQLVLMAAVLRESRKKGNQLNTPIGHREIRDTVKLAGPEEEFMSFEEAARIKVQNQAALEKDRSFISDTIDEEL